MIEKVLANAKQAGCEFGAVSSFPKQCCYLVSQMPIEKA